MIEQNKQMFINLVKENVHREGVDSLLDWLGKTNFFHDPASTKFHSDYEGGLCQHSLNVYARLIKLLQNEYGDSWQEKCSMESAVLIGLFHDICKVDTYAVSMRNIKENGV